MTEIQLKVDPKPPHGYLGRASTHGSQQVGLGRGVGMATRSKVEVERRRRTDPAGQAEPSLERVTVNLTARSSRALDGAVRLTSLNKTDSINRAVQLYGYLQEVIEAGGDIYVRPLPGGELELLKVF
jgi:hypothetical protein